LLKNKLLGKQSGKAIPTPALFSDSAQMIGNSDLDDWRNVTHKQYDKLGRDNLQFSLRT
jgi:hypothetical protein